MLSSTLLALWNILLVTFPALRILVSAEGLRIGLTDYNTLFRQDVLLNRTTKFQALSIGALFFSAFYLPDLDMNIIYMCFTLAVFADFAWDYYVVLDAKISEA